MGIILTSFKHSFVLIKKNIPLFLLIFVIQTLFLSLNGYILTETIDPAISSIQTSLDYMSNIDNGSLGEDPLLLYKSFKSAAEKMILFAVFLILNFALINGINWALTDQLVNKKNLKDFLFYIVNFVFISIITLTTLSLFIIQLGRSITNLSTITSFISILLLPILSVIIIYLMFLSFSQIFKNNIKSIIRRTLSLSLTSFFPLITVFFINSLVLVLISLLVYSLFESNLVVLVLLLVLEILVLIWTRLFLILTASKVEK